MINDSLEVQQPYNAMQGVWMSMYSVQRSSFEIFEKIPLVTKKIGHQVELKGPGV